MAGYDKRVADMSPAELRTARERDRKRRIRGQLDRARRRVAQLEREAERLGLVV